MKTLVVLHGTRTVFETFSNDVEARFSTGQNLLGHFFTDKPEQALVYSEPTVDEVCDELGFDDDLERDDAEFIDFCEENPGVILKVEATFNSMKIEPASSSGLSKIDQMQLNFSDDDFLSYRESLVREGFDAVCFETPDGYCEYAFLNADQLRILEVIPANDFRQSLETAPTI